MQLIPAVDFYQGRCVRLKQGDPDQCTPYAVNPDCLAARWADLGIRRMHVVNLDGAFTGTSHANERAIAVLVKATSLEVELGGGIRTADDIARWLDAGVTCVILGTAAVENPALADEAVCRFGEQALAAGVDVRNGVVAVRGWTSLSSLTPQAFARDMEARGMRRFIYTGIHTDGMMQGPDLEGLCTFACQVSSKVTASGGVRDVNDLLHIAKNAPPNVDSVIAGRALYEGTLDAADAVQALAGGGGPC